MLERKDAEQRNNIYGQELYTYFLTVLMGISGFHITAIPSFPAVTTILNSTESAMQVISSVCRTNTVGPDHCKLYANNAIIITPRDHIEGVTFGTLHNTRTRSRMKNINGFNSSFSSLFITENQIDPMMHLLKILVEIRNAITYLDSVETVFCLAVSAQFCNSKRCISFSKFHVESFSLMPNRRHNGAKFSIGVSKSSSRLSHNKALIILPSHIMVERPELPEPRRKRLRCILCDSGECFKNDADDEDMRKVLDPLPSLSFIGLAIRVILVQRLNFSRHFATSSGLTCREHLNFLNPSDANQNSDAAEQPKVVDILQSLQLSH
uniref:Uncharacterized protein n=1 Tax=Glossina pallidipes TaxID=7398 RepID=A0A1B0A357_GLOPL